MSRRKRKAPAAAPPAPPPKTSTVRFTSTQLRLTADALATHSRWLARAARRAGARTSTGIMAESILAAHMAKVLGDLSRGGR